MKNRVAFPPECMCWVLVYLVELISEFYFSDLASHLRKG